MDEAQDKPKKNPKVNREERRAYWQRQIQRAMESGIPISRFCREHGISLPSFNYWRKALKEKEPGSNARIRNFVQLKVSDSKEATQGIRLELGRGLYLQFNREPSAAWIQEVAQCLREEPS